MPPGLAMRSGSTPAGGAFTIHAGQGRLIVSGTDADAVFVDGERQYGHQWFNSFAAYWA